MKHKTLAIFGIATYILSVISSAENLAGDYTMPLALIFVSAIAFLIFTIMAVIYLWKTQKTTAILFLIFSLVSLVYLSPIIKIINLVMLIWVISLLWAMAKYEKLTQNPEDNSNIISK